MPSFTIFDAETSNQTLSGFNTGVVTLSGSLVTTGSAITANGSSPVVIIAGLVSASFAAVNANVVDLTVMNDGMMYGGNSTGVYVSASGTMSIANTGLLTGRDHGVYSYGAGDDLITNSGMISGRINSLYLSEGASEVINSGTLGGDVVLNEGADLFNGSTGTQGEIFGGDGNDTILGGLGAETLRGDDGGDLLVGNGGDDSLFGGDDTDRLRGGAGEDILQGDAGSDQMWGGEDDDTLVGGTGLDTIRGGAGNDSLMGGLDDDWLMGGTGDDRLTGGGGIDRFVFQRNQGTDRITDFANDADKIDLQDFGFANSAQVTALASSVSGGVRIDLPGEGVLFVQGLTMITLNSNDLIL